MDKILLSIDLAGSSSINLAIYIHNYTCRNKLHCDTYDLFLYSNINSLDLDCSISQLTPNLTAGTDQISSIAEVAPDALRLNLPIHPIVR